MYDDDDFVPDENDKLYDEIDAMVDFAEKSSQGRDDPGHKFDVRPDVAGLMLDEVDLSDVNIYQQSGGSWIAEIKYRGFNFISVAEKELPDSWAEFLQELGDDDEEDDDNDD